MYNPSSPARKIDITCPACKLNLRVNDTAAGTQLKCPNCNTLLVVSAVAEAAKKNAPPATVFPVSEPIHPAPAAPVAGVPVPNKSRFKNFGMFAGIGMLVIFVSYILIVGFVWLAKHGITNEPEAALPIEEIQVASNTNSMPSVPKIVLPPSASTPSTNNYPRYTNPRWDILLEYMDPHVLQMVKTDSLDIKIIIAIIVSLIVGLILLLIGVSIHFAASLQQFNENQSPHGSPHNNQSKKESKK